LLYTLRLGSRAPSEANLAGVCLAHRHWNSPSYRTAAGNISPGEHRASVAGADLLPPKIAGANSITPSGAEGDRTPDLCSAIAALSQLSYSPWWLLRRNQPRDLRPVVKVPDRSEAVANPRPPGPPLAHALTSQYVTDQLRLRTVPANRHPPRTDGEYVLYWMQSTHRLDENWALRHAAREANRLGLPLLIHQGLDPTYAHASDRIHHRILAGARETASRADALGYVYQFVLRHRVDDDRRVIDRLARRAALVVTDLFPTAGIARRTARFAARASTECLVVAVDSACIVPSGTFTTEQYSAAVIRPKLARLRDHALEPVADRHPLARPVPTALHQSLKNDLPYPPLTLRSTDIDTDIDQEIARCEIDHDVHPVDLPPGRAGAIARLEQFLDHGLARYDTGRKDPTDADGSTRLSPYLHFGHIGAAEVARAALARGPRHQTDALLDELMTWRELAFNFCLRNRHHDRLQCLPTWAQTTLAKHTRDPRPDHYTRRELEAARTNDALWNAAQRELRRAGVIHNAVRMVWGKSVLLWTGTYRTALRTLILLNDKYAIDGRDPNSYLNILWCFGKFDRPYPERAVWGTVRPMSLARAREKFDADAYIASWTA
jgi:deoxyribodipyrimidine photo-lyase